MTSPKKFETILTHALGYTEKNLIDDITRLANVWKQIGMFNQISFIFGIYSFYDSLVYEPKLVMHVSRVGEAAVQYFLGDILLCKITYNGLEHMFIDVPLFKSLDLNVELLKIVVMPEIHYTQMQDILHNYYRVILK